MILYVKIYILYTIMKPFAKEQILRIPGCLYSLFLFFALNFHSDFAGTQNVKQPSKKPADITFCRLNKHKIVFGLYIHKDKTY